jgi:hypothetical protein
LKWSNVWSYKLCCKYAEFERISLTNQLLGNILFSDVSITSSADWLNWITQCASTCTRGISSCIKNLFIHLSNNVLGKKQYNTNNSEITEKMFLFLFKNVSIFVFKCFYFCFAMLMLCMVWHSRGCTVLILILILKFKKWIKFKKNPTNRQFTLGLILLILQDFGKKSISVLFYCF